MRAAVFGAMLAAVVAAATAFGSEPAPVRSRATLFILDPACNRYDAASGSFVRDADPGKGQPCDVAGRSALPRVPGDRPASSVGVLYNGPYKSTAFFVGKCQIVTNCHAAFLDVTHPSSSQKSLFAFGQNGKITDLFAEHVPAIPEAWGSCACAATERTGENDCSVEEGAQDWALLKLQGCDGEDYGARYGYALLDPQPVIDPAGGKPDAATNAPVLFALGEPTTVLLPGETGRPNDDKKPGVNDYMTGAWKSAPCEIRTEEGGMEFHSCPDVPGDSGGPIGFVDGRGVFHVVAIQRGMGTGDHPAEPMSAWDPRNANKAVPVRNFYDAVIPYIRADQDALKDK